MKDTMNYASWGTHYVLKFRKGTYQNNGNTAVQIVCKDDDCDCYLPWGMLTVNLGRRFNNPYKACLDANNLSMNMDLIEHLIKEGVFSLTDTEILSGLCSYPVIVFNKEWLDALTEI